ncbi:MAG: hypothetical protein AAGF24_10845 [Cyanobacteria bacterium P01_H01_bin.121]
MKRFDLQQGAGRLLPLGSILGAVLGIVWVGSWYWQQRLTRLNPDTTLMLVPQTAAVVLDLQGQFLQERPAAANASAAAPQAPELIHGFIHGFITELTESLSQQPQFAGSDLSQPQPEPKTSNLLQAFATQSRTGSPALLAIVPVETDPPPVTAPPLTQPGVEWRSLVAGYRSDQTPANELLAQWQQHTGSRPQRLNVQGAQVYRCCHCANSSLAGV